MDDFVFDSLTLDDLVKYTHDSNVFNVTRDDLKNTKITLASFSDEKLGSAIERLDVAYKVGSKWSLVDMRKAEDFNEVPLEWLISDIDSVSDCLVIIRRMSNMLLDKNKYSMSKYIYHVVDDKYKYITENPMIIGKLSRYGILIDGGVEDIISNIEKGVKDDYDKSSLINFIKCGDVVE